MLNLLLELKKSKGILVKLFVLTIIKSAITQKIALSSKQKKLVVVLTTFTLMTINLETNVKTAL